MTLFEFESYKGTLDPQYFFEFEADIYELKKHGSLSDVQKYVLPSLSKLWNEEQFATVSMGWSANSLSFLVDVKNDEVKPSYPDIQKGDSIELFIDTRNLKNSKLVHRFCHHFYFLPARIDGVMSKEITRFHGDDKHTLCNQDDIEVVVKIRKNGYVSEITIPDSALFGFQPDEVKELGFSYRINRFNGFCQQFTPHKRIEEHPYLWATVKLIP